MSVWLVFGWAVTPQVPAGAPSTPPLRSSLSRVLHGMGARDAEDGEESTGKRPHQAPFSSAMENNVKSDLVEL